MLTPCEQIARSIGELFACTQVNRYVRIRTPYLYPDGDVIDLFFKEETGGRSGGTVTDLGETLRWLRMQRPTKQKSAKQRRLMEDVCLTHNVELYRGMLMVRVTVPTELASAVTRLAQACLRVSDLWFTFRARAIESTTDEVAELLTERYIPFERGERLPGRSGRIWTVDFHTRHARRSALVLVLSTGSRAAARGVSEHVLATWYDLSHLRVGAEAQRFVSLFDDTMDVWTQQDFKLVEDISDVARWSRPDEFAELLVA